MEVGLFDPATIVDVKEEQKFDVDANMFPEDKSDDDFLDFLDLTLGEDEEATNKGEFAQWPMSLDEIWNIELEDAAIHLLDLGAVFCRVVDGAPTRHVVDHTSIVVVPAVPTPPPHAMDPPGRAHAM